MNFDFSNVLIRTEVITLFLLEFRQEINMQNMAFSSPAPQKIKNQV
jgi:hypothetical protein